MAMAAAILIVAACNGDDSSEQHTCPPENPSWAELQEINRVVAELVEECQDFAPSAVALGLPGEWTLDSELMYDDKWQEVVALRLFMGKAYDYEIELGYTRYTFKTDSTGFCYRNDSKVTPDALRFNWSYDVINRVLELSGEYCAKYTVSGYNRDYVMLDRAYDGLNSRTILKRNCTDEKSLPIEFDNSECNIKMF